MLWPENQVRIKSYSPVAKEEIKLGWEVGFKALAPVMFPYGGAPPPMMMPPG